MPIAEHPLHRSGRAALPHPAPTLGDDAQAHEGIRVADASSRQPGVDQRLHATPGQMITLTAPPQDSPPYSADGKLEGTDRRAIHRDAVVTHVAENNRTQVRAYLGDGVVHSTLEFGFHLSQLRLPPFSHRLTKHRKATHSRLPATVREAQEVKALRCAPITASVSIVPRKAAELDESRLLG